MGTDPLKVAVLGCGVVGAEVVQRLHRAGRTLGHRAGRALEVAGVAVRDPARPRAVGIDPDLFTDDPFALVKREDIDIVVEVMGGLEPARSLITQAMTNGAAVVTANKALIAQDGAELHRHAARWGVDLHYEAAVAGAIPLLRALRESLAGDDIVRIIGIVNGTTNFVLDQMTDTGCGLEEALGQAAARGYAEADPTADVEGHDAVAKAVILTALAFHTWAAPHEVHREGITGITPADIARARALDCKVKLVAVCERDHLSGAPSIRVHPVMVPFGHPFASVQGADNAVVVESAASGRLMFHGAGAGGAPTAGAVLGDVVAAARNRVAGTAPLPPPLLTHTAAREHPVHAWREGPCDGLLEW